MTVSVATATWSIPAYWFPRKMKGQRHVGAAGVYDRVRWALQRHHSCSCAQHRASAAQTRSGQAPPPRIPILKQARVCNGKMIRTAESALDSHIPVMFGSLPPLAFVRYHPHDLTSRSSATSIPLLQPTLRHRCRRRLDSSRSEGSPQAAARAPRPTRQFVERGPCAGRASTYHNAGTSAVTIRRVARG